MRRVGVCLLVILFSFTLVNAQIPQFAVVRPDGTTYVCPTWDSAYNKAIDGDNIYMPGITISETITLNKRLFIYGSGHNPDSSSVTGTTTVSGGNILIGSGAEGGSIEGLNHVSANIYFVFSGKRINGYTIKRCRIGSIQVAFINGGPTDSLPTNLLITECIIGNIDFAGGAGTDIYKNIIQYEISNTSFCTIKNNIFLASGFPPLGNLINNCIIENNIFLASAAVSSGNGCTSNFYNNLKLNSTPLLSGCLPNSGGIESGTISVASINDVFVAFDPTFANYPYIDNYHLKPTCPGVNAGTDGTDVGIFGTSQPTNLGWVPSNPHIYFKQVAPQTNSNGQLQIQFKVRTNN